MRKDSIKALIDSLPEDDLIEITFKVYTGDGWNSPQEPEPEVEEYKPDTILVQVDEEHAFHKVVEYNEKGVRILGNAGLGKAEHASVWEVEFPKADVDGSIDYWKIWRGDDGDKSYRNLYLRADKCVKL